MLNFNKSTYVKNRANIKGIYIYIYIQGVSEGIVNTLGGVSMDYSE